MPYYSELGLTSLPSSSAYSSLFLSGPYSNHSSIIASNYSPSSLSKPTSRQFRGGYKPHLTTISELNSPLRRINSPKLLYQSSPKVNVRPIKKINTADIDVSVNKYRKFEKYEKPKTESVERKPVEKPKEISASPIKVTESSTSSTEVKEAKPNAIKRDRATIRLHTIHKDAVQKEIGAIRSWRDNFKPEELEGTEAKRHKKTPGEILKEKFLIRSRSKENLLKISESKKTSRKSSVRKSPSFHDICTAITSENIDVDLNPGQPVEVKRRQSRQISSENIIKEIRRTSTELSEEDLKILDAILSDPNQLSSMSEVVKQEDEVYESRESVRKKKVTKNRSNESLIIDQSRKSPNRITQSQSKEKVNEYEGKLPLQRRPTKKMSRRPSEEDDVEIEVKDMEPLTNDIYKNMIRDISQVEIEQTAFKPKKVITATVGDIDEIKSVPKAFVDDIEVQETPKSRKDKKFKFNVIVEVEEEQKSNKITSTTPDEIKIKRRSSFKLPKTTAKKITLSDKNRGMVQLPHAKEPLILSILKKRPNVHVGQILEEEEEKVEDDVKFRNKIETAEDKPNTINADGIKASPPLVKNKFSKSNIKKLTIDLVKSDSYEDIAIKEVTNTASTPLSPNLIDSNEKSDILKTKDKSGDTTTKSSVNKLKNQLAVDRCDKEISPAPLTSPVVNEKNPPKNIISQINKPVPITSIIKEEMFKKETSPSLTLSISNKEDPAKNVTSQINKPAAISSITKGKSFLSNENTYSPSSPITNMTNVFNLENVKKDEIPSSSTLNRDNDIFGNKIVLEHFTSSEKVEKVTNEPVGSGPTSTSEPTEVVKKYKNDNIINLCESLGDPTEDFHKEESLKKEELPKKLISKRSLVQKANKDDPDLEVFVAPEPEPEPEPEKEKSDVFVPLQSNRLSQWMHPWKKPEQFEECPIEIFARPKIIRGRHYPRPRGHPAQPIPKPESSSEEEGDNDDEQEESEESSSDESTSSEEECDEVMVNNIGASTSSNDSGFGSGAPGTNKGSLEIRDSPISNHANNPAFALDSGDFPEEYSQSSTFTGFQKSGRITPPATTIPRFRKYCVDDFNFLKVLGKGSFGKVLLAELKGTEYYYAIKCLKKDVVLEDDDVECTLIERKVLALGTKHPYLCHLLCTFQTESHLFFVMEYLNGGDLMFHIQDSGRFPEHQARFYGAEIVSGLKFLHNKGIVYRDLKLDNILLDFDGHVRIADFGMCKLQIFLDRMAETFCGTPDYMAPEIIKGLHYNQGVDWWSFGVLLYEMLLGQSPFSGCDEDELFWSICNEKPVLPKFLSSEATNILTLLLEKDASKRLGNRFCPNGDIQDQPFFRQIDWIALESRQMEPPFKPNLQHPLDTQYFDKHFTVEKAKLTPIETTILQSMDQTQFQGFSYTNPNATDK